MVYPESNMAEQDQPLTPEEQIEILREKVRVLENRNQALEELVRVDELTGIGNRRSFDEEMHRETARAIRNKQPLALIFADLDDLKKINDNGGHRAGDLALQQLAGVLEHGIRETDRVCRIGGDEFAIILPDIFLDHAIGVAVRLHHKIETLNFTASFGIGLFIPTDQSQKETIENIINSLMYTADKTMYLAKEAGRGRIGFLTLDGKIGILEKNSTNSSKMAIKYPKP